MPTNLLKKYNQLLELRALNEFQRQKSLLGIFNRDIVNNDNFSFRHKRLNPTPADGENAMQLLFRHLTTVITDKATRHREFEYKRSVRLHWIRFHVEESKKENVYVFSVDEPSGKRTYIYDKDEEYVIVLEPMRRKPEYYLLSAYHLDGKDLAREKMMRKYARRLPFIL